MTGKNFYVLVDPVGNSVIHGRPDIDRKWSLDTDYIPGQDTDNEPMKLCPVCGVMNAPDNDKCHICRFDFLTGLLDGKPIDKKLFTLLDDDTALSNTKVPAADFDPNNDWIRFNWRYPDDVNVCARFRTSVGGDTLQACLHRPSQQ